MKETMGQIIKRLRKERNLTQEELAEQLGVTFQAVSKWENENGMPDISQVVPLATVFNVSTDVLFGIYGTSDAEEVDKIIKEAYSKIYEFTSGVEVDYEFFEDKGMKRTTTGTYTNLTETNIISVYRRATNNNTLSATNLPSFYLTTYDVVVANLDNKDYHTLVFTDMESVNRKDVEFTDDKTDKIKLVKFSELSANIDNMDNDNKLTVNYLRVSEYLGKEVGDKFYCVGVYDSAYNTYDSFVFYKIK